MNTRFASSLVVSTLVASALMAASMGSAHAEGLNLRNLSHADAAGYELIPGINTPGALTQRQVVDEADLQAIHPDSCGGGSSHCPVAHKWSVLGPADVADARYVLTESELHTHLPAGTGVQYELSPQVGLRLEYQQHPRGNALDLKPTVGEVAVGFKVAF